MNRDDLQHRTYLGDGLYAGWDGFQVILWCEREGHQIHWVALEAMVLGNLLAWAKHTIELVNQPPTAPDGTSGS